MIWAVVLILLIGMFCITHQIYVLDERIKKLEESKDISEISKDTHNTRKTMWG